MPAQLKTKQEIEIPTLYARDFAYLERQRGLLQVVYVLIDPRTGERRYVGQTITPIIVRLRVHLSSSLSTRSHAASWIRSLLRLGLVPQVEILECVEVDDLDDREIFWIAELKRQGCRLTNSAIGGASGNRGLKHSPEVIAKRIAVIKANYWADPERQARRRALSKNLRPPVQLGELNNRAKLTEAQVIQIRREAGIPGRLSEWAQRLDMTYAGIAAAAYGKVWNISEPPAVAPPSMKLTEADVELIRNLIGLGMRNMDIAPLFNVDRSHISKIKTGDSRPPRPNAGIASST